ncbi:hypothetical protein TWF103_002164 [Orbilia oligospora]|nr:hypothetical protein TWF103_002164 [Orbilia oligospora]
MLLIKQTPDSPWTPILLDFLRPSQVPIYINYLYINETNKMKLPTWGSLALLSLLPSACLAQSQHTSNWAVLVSTSRFWFNYRHLANVLSMYRTVKRLGIPDSQIILMLSDDVACNPRNTFPGTVYNNADRAIDLYGDNIEVDYRGYEVTVENFIRLLTDRVPPDTPRSKRLLTDDRSNIFIYMTGHGGNEFLKFQDAEEISAFDIADAFQQMFEKKRYNEMLFMIDTCQANTMYSKFYSPNILATGSSELDQSSYSHHADNDVGVAVIDRYTYFNLEYLETHVKNASSKHTLADLFSSYDPVKIASTPGIRTDLFRRNLSEVLITDFLGNVQNVEVDGDGMILDEDLLALARSAGYNITEQEWKDAMTGGYHEKTQEERDNVVGEQRTWEGPARVHRDRESDFWRNVMSAGAVGQNNSHSHLPNQQSLGHQKKSQVMSFPSRTASSFFSKTSISAILESINRLDPDFAGARIYTPNEQRHYTPKAYTFIIWTCSIFFAILIVSLGWICIRRDINPRLGTLKHKEREKFRKRTRQEFHFRVLQMMKETQLQEEMERIQKEKDKTYKEKVNRFMKNVEEGKREIMRARIEASLKREAEKVDILTEEPVMLLAMRNMMEAGKKTQAERKRAREQRKREKGRVATPEERKKTKAEKRMAKKEIQKERMVLLNKFKEAWDESASSVRKKERARDTPISRDNLMKGRRYVPRVY